MARIKFVLNERRLLYEGALKIFAEKKVALRPPQTGGPPTTDKNSAA